MDKIGLSTNENEFKWMGKMNDVDDVDDEDDGVAEDLSVVRL